MPPALVAWRQVVDSRDMAALHDLLDDEVVFHSPVVNTPQHGAALTARFLEGAWLTLNNGRLRYVRAIVGPDDALLESTTEIDGIVINGIDLIRWNEAGRIVDFKVMMRPLKAVNALHAAMGAMPKRLG